MRARPFVSVLVVVTALAAWPLELRQNVALAGVSPAEHARRTAVAARVGPAEVTVGELEDRIAAVPRFQLRAFGDTEDAIRRQFFDQILVPEILYALEANKTHVGDALPTSSKVLRAAANSAVKVVRQSVPPVTSISMDQIRRYFEENKSKYDSPERLYLFRVLCAKNEEAAAVLAEAKKEPTLEVFTRLARDHSIDKATALRGGNLGYLTPDGVSSEAGLSVDPALVAAAHGVRDGDIVPAPIPEAGGFAVIWRRGTLPASHRTPEEAAGEIRESIWKRAVDAETKKHIEELRAAHVSDLNDSLLNGIDISANEAEVVTRRRPGEVAPLSQGGRNVPRPSN